MAGDRVCSDSALASILVGCVLVGAGCAAMTQEPTTGERVEGASTAEPLSEGEEAVPEAPRIVQFDVGHEEGCFVTSDGEVYCWARTGRRPGEPASPRRVAGVVDAVQVVVGQGVSCARRRGGAVRCWGTHGAGVRGAGTNTDPSATDVVELSDAVDLATEDHVVCAVRATGAVMCWGLNSGHEFADGTDVPSNRPRRVPGIDSAVSIGGHWLSGLCAVLRDGSVSCWGRNPAGDVRHAGGGQALTTPTPVPELDRVDAVDRRRQYGCALRSGGVWCWGWGAVVPGADYPPIGPTQVPGVEGALGLSLSINRACARTRSAVVCWRRRGVPKVVAEISEIVDFWAGDHSICTLDREGTLSCERRGGVDEFSVPVTDAAPAPDAVEGWVSAPLPGVSSPAWLGLDDDILCVGTGEPRPRCWGLDSPPEAEGYDGRAGYDCFLVSGGVECVDERVRGIRRAVEISVEGMDGCARMRNGSVSCWGLWNPDSVSYPPVRATPVEGVAGARRVSAGDAASCALLPGGSLRCWDNPPIVEAHERARPVASEEVTGLGDVVVGVAAGRAHVCALVRSGRVRCWGEGARGQLGTGGLADADAPVDVVGLDDAIAIDASGDVTCVVRQSGEVACWGRPPEPVRPGGLLGDQRAEAVVPWTVADLPPAASIHLAASRACMVTRVGEVVCWGAHHLP